MDSIDAMTVLVEKVAQRRAEDAMNDVKKHYPDATMKIEALDGRGILTFCNGRFVVSKEFVETVKSLSSHHCMMEYRHVLQGKARLVLIVPKIEAPNTFTRMLELNNWWLFYYQIFYYDEEGEIRKMDRKAWCSMSGRPYEPPARAPEIA
jgi:hypothetical protein